MSLAKSTKKISQKEYLKKYLSGDTKKRKHKSHKPKNAIKVKIIDDDANLIPDLDIDEELLLTGEDAPQIVGTYIEEKTNDEGKKWRSIGIKDEVEDEEEVKTEIKVEEDLWGPKSVDRRYKDEFSPERAANGNKSIPSDVKTEDSRSNEGKKKHRKDFPKKRKKKSHRNAENFKSNDSSRLQNNYSAKTRDSSLDQSPPRCRTRKSSEGLEISNSKDQSPPRRKRRDSSADQSPPRRKVRDRERSPSRYNKGKSSRDQSPPRRRSRDKSNDHRRRQRRSRSRSDDHTSHGHRKSDSDLSPPRARGSRSAFKSPLKIKQERASPDLSPKRNYNGRYEERIHRKFKQEPLSPKATTSQYRASRWEERKTSRSVSPPPSHKPKVTTEGKRAGLQDAKSLQQECEEFRLREDEMFKKMTSEASGRDAEVQVRDYGRRGRRAREVLELDPAEELRKEAHEKKKKDLYDRWGKGLKQIEAHRARIDEDVYEGSKPLARYSNDADLEKHLRDQERADDPMLEYMRKRRKDPEKQTNAPITPSYKGSYPENRFDLRPGYRWDGVDRSNGYEKKWFDKQNEKRAAQDEAYMYSVEDM